MGWYLLKLCLLLPAIGFMIWGSLKLLQKTQSRFAATQATKSASVVEIIGLSPTQRLLVVEFHGRRVLIGATRQGLVRLSEVPIEAVQSEAAQ